MSGVSQQQHFSDQIEALSRHFQKAKVSLSKLIKEYLQLTLFLRNLLSV